MNLPQALSLSVSEDKSAHSIVPIQEGKNIGEPPMVPGKKSVVSTIAGGCGGSPPQPAAVPGMGVTILAAHSEGAFMLAFLEESKSQFH